MFYILTRDLMIVNLGWLLNRALIKRVSLRVINFLAFQRFVVELDDAICILSELDIRCNLHAPDVKPF